MHFVTISLSIDNGGNTVRTSENQQGSANNDEILLDIQNLREIDGRERDKAKNDRKNNVDYSHDNDDDYDLHSIKL